MHFVRRDQGRVRGSSSREAHPAGPAHDRRAPTHRLWTVADSYLVALWKRPAAESTPAQAQSRRVPRRSRISRFHFHAYSPPFFAQPQHRRSLSTLRLLRAYFQFVAREMNLRETIPATRRRQFERPRVWSLP